MVNYSIDSKLVYLALKTKRMLVNAWIVEK